MNQGPRAIIGPETGEGARIALPKDLAFGGTRRWCTDVRGPRLAVRSLSVRIILSTDAKKGQDTSRYKQTKPHPRASTETRAFYFDWPEARKPCTAPDSSGERYG